MSLHRDGRRLGSNEIVELGDEDRCSHPGCEVVVGRIVPHPNGLRGYLTQRDTAECGEDMHYRSRCKAHAERPDGQLNIFEEGAA